MGPFCLPEPLSRDAPSKTGAVPPCPSRERDPLSDLARFSTRLMNLPLSRFFGGEKNTPAPWSSQW
jgi:hypothetical protein